MSFHLKIVEIIKCFYQIIMKTVLQKCIVIMVLKIKHVIIFFSSKSNHHDNAGFLTIKKTLYFVHIIY